MLPLIDMCNHSFTPNCKLQPAGGGTLQLVALQDIPHQQPLLLSYGSLSNDFLLMDYGFVVPNNPFDRVQLSFNLDLLEVKPPCDLSLWLICITSMSSSSQHKQFDCCASVSDCQLQLLVLDKTFPQKLTKCSSAH